MSLELEQLRKQLREAQEREQAERRLREGAQEREQAERRLREGAQEREQAERRLREEAQEREQAERQRAEGAEEQNRPTSLYEYIDACHGLVFSRFSIETDKRLTSKGSITNPHYKYCPTHLRSWMDFIGQQKLVFGTLCDTFPLYSRLFESRGFLAGLGNRVSQRSIADEKALEHFLHNSVEDPVRAIIEQLKQVDEARSAFDISDGIVFENHPHALSNAAEEVIDRETLSTPQTSNDKQDLRQLRPDQICVYRSNYGPSENRTMIYVCEYKPPHKLTALQLRVGLRDMNIPQDVVNRKTIPTSAAPEARFKYHAERLAASAVTQTYHYMIEGGLEYGLLTTGEAIVFLKINWEEPETLYYHLAEPGSEVSAHPVYFHVCTAVGQYLAFSLMALGSLRQQRTPGQEERSRIKLGLSTWEEDFETTSRSTPASERSLSSSSPAYQPPTTYKDDDRSPYLLRGRSRQAGPPNQVERQMLRRDQSESSDDDLTTNPPGNPSPTEMRSRRRGGQETQRGQQIVPERRHGGGEQGRKYCTQKCLLGLVNAGFLDPKCPNSKFHRRQDSYDRDNDHARIQMRACTQVRHPIDHAEWLQLLWKQLERSLDEGIMPLGEGGARGVLFQVTLLEYSYIFVGKGTVRAFIRDLEHEAAVYKRLRPIQGVNVPVFLGAIDLRLMNKIYYYDHRVYVVHIMFLSWGGEHINIAESTDSERKLLETMAMRSLRAIHQNGVIHRDVRAPNMLFNRDINGVMMIDFERASTVKSLRNPLAPWVPNKRARKQEGMNVKKATVDSSNLSQSNRGFQEDISMATMALLGWNL